MYLLPPELHILHPKDALLSHKLGAASHVDPRSYEYVSHLRITTFSKSLIVMRVRTYRFPESPPSIIIAHKKGASPLGDSGPKNVCRDPDYVAGLHANEYARRKTTPKSTHLVIVPWV